MSWFLSRSLAFLLAAAVATVSALALVSQPIYDLYSGGTIIECDCIIPMRMGTEDWPLRSLGAFAIRTPDETTLHPTSRYDGAIVDRRFTLSYNIDERVDDGALARTGQNYREQAVTVGGRPAVMRWAQFPGRADPIFVALVVPQAIKAKDGRWLALEIHGWVTTGEQAWLAERMLTSVDFAPPFDVPVAPERVRVLPPMIEIDSTSQRIAP